MNKRQGILFSVSAIASAIVASIYFMDSHSQTSQGSTINTAVIQSPPSKPAVQNSNNQKPTSIAVKQNVLPSQVNNASPFQANNIPAFDIDQNSDASTGFADNNLLDIERGENFFATQNKRPDNNKLFLKSKKRSGILIGDARDAEKLILESAADYLGLTASDELQLLDVKRDENGMVAYKFEQSITDIPVFDRQIIVESYSNNELALVMGQLEPQLSVNTTPNLSSNEAVNSAFDSMDIDLDNSAPDILRDPQLMIYVDDKEIAHLTYSTVIRYQTSNSELRIERVFINAHNGDVVSTINRMQTALNRTIYTLNEQCMSSNMSSSLPGTQVSANTDSHTQPAHDNAGHAYWFYKHMFGIDSYDNQGIEMKASVHALFQNPNSWTRDCNGDNAFFSPDDAQIVYGQGGTNLNNPPSALDISGHEWTHGLTSKTSNLTYRNESGALNESFSDIVGSVIEGWVNSGGTENGNPDTGITMNEGDWEIGEDVASDDSGWVRFLYNPTKDGRSYDDYDNRYTGREDEGGVHSNSGISNLAFYLLSEGGTHPDSSVSTNNVQGIGVEKSIKLFYKSFTSLTSSADFKTAGNRVAFDAANLYGDCSQELDSVQKAFEAVNIQGDWSQITVTSDGTCPDDTTTPDDDSGNTDTGSGTGNTDTGSGNTSNYALGEYIESSSSLGSFYSASKAVDGNMSSNWVSRNIYSSYQSEWIGSDLGQERNISSVRVHWNGTDYARNVTVWVWDMAQNNWKQTATTSSGTAGTLQLDFATQTSRYIYISMSGGNYRRWYAISEFEVR
jgi:Zn-dependent metalloprotease